MDKKERQLKLYYDQALELIASYEGKNLVGKIFGNREDVREAYIKKAKDLLSKIIEIDRSSSYAIDIQQRLSSLQEKKE